MKFEVINMEKWPRREHFEYYTTQVKTAYQINVEMDVTKLRKRCKKKVVRFYPAMIYAIMKAVNENKEFRMGYHDGRLGYYKKSHPTYTIFHEDDETFSDIWTEYHSDFETFYDAVMQDMEKYKDEKGMKTKKDRPEAFACISCIPWVNFSSYSHDSEGPGDMFFPVFTYGKMYERENRWYLTVSLYVSHAAADGYHAAKLMNDIQSNIKNCKEWMQ